MAFEKMKQAKAAREADRAAAVHQQRIAAKEWEMRQAYDALEASKLTDENGPPRIPGVVLKKDEVAYGSIQGAALIEPRRTPGQWTGGSKGVSFRIAKGVTYRVGNTRGTYAQGEERPTPVDTGLFVVTNQRCIFIGGKRSTEWAYAKLLGFSLDGEAVAMFNVSNRQKTTGVMYAVEVEPFWDAFIAAAIAKFGGDDHYEALRAELADAYRELYEEWQALRETTV